jgi:hypothetical protein
MVLINTTSLSRTVDAVSAATFYEQQIPARDRGKTARWIAARQGLSGAYGNTFAGYPGERTDGIVLFTGERITSASARHMDSPEAAKELRYAAPVLERAARRARPSATYAARRHDVAVRVLDRA